MSKEVKQDKVIDAKSMLKEAGFKKRKIKFNDRVDLVVLKDTKFYRENQRISPHRVIAEELIKNKIAKEV
jgi:hypothetical protein